jgi:hypothetical protein
MDGSLAQLNRIWAGAQIVPLMEGFRYRAAAAKGAPSNTGVCEGGEEGLTGRRKDGGCGLLLGWVRNALRQGRMGKRRA